MSVKRYSAEPWQTVKIRKKLYESIWKQIDKAKVKGVRKYDSVPAFIHEACLRLLEQEGLDTSKAKIAEVVAN